MKITFTTKAKFFADVKQGVPFSIQGELYLKIKEVATSTANAVRLRDGEVEHFEGNAWVEERNDLEIIVK